jgi:hypothetical protein
MPKPKVVVTTMRPFPQSMSPAIRMYIGEDLLPEIRWESSVDALPFPMARVFADALAEMAAKAEAIAAASKRETEREAKSARWRKRPA